MQPGSNQVKYNHNFRLNDKDAGIRFILFIIDTSVNTYDVMKLL